jgi:pimeloyl-ACP methyl ester carboxylesterase
MSRIQIAGVSVEYLDQGRGQPVVLLHSTGGSSAQWRALADRLSARYHVIAPDLYGYGATANWPGRSVFGLEHEMAIVDALLDRFDAPAHLVGHSYGGAVALHVARKRSEVLRSLTLIEPVAFHLLRTGDEIDAAALREITQIGATVTGSLACGDYAGGFGRFVDYWSGPGTWSGMPAAKRDGLAGRLAKVALDFHATIREPTRPADFRRIMVPTLLVQGACTTLPTQRICLRLARTLRSVDVKTINGAGHMSPLTHRDEVNDLIVAHLNANSPVRCGVDATLVAAQ